MSSVVDFMIPVKLKSEEQNATAGQTVFTLSSIVIPNADEDRLIVNIMGKKQPKTAGEISKSICQNTKAKKSISN